MLDQAGYVSKIPAILQQLRVFLVENGGLDQIGIFRLAPDQKLCEIVKNELNKVPSD